MAANSNTSSGPRDALEEDILTGVIKPGARLDETVLAARFGVSEGASACVESRSPRSSPGSIGFRRPSRCASPPNPYCRVAVLEPSRARLLSTSHACLPPSPRPRRPFLLATAARHGRQDPLGGEILLPVIIFDNQRLESTFLDSLKLMLSSFQRVPQVSALVLEPCRRRQAAARREPCPRASGPCRRAPPLRPALLNLPSPAALSTPRRSAAAAAQFAAGPPLAVAPPLQTTPSPQTTTHRCARAPSTFPQLPPRRRGRTPSENGHPTLLCTVPSAKDLP